MRLLVAGGRHLDDVTPIRRALDRVHAMGPITVVIHGGSGFLGIASEDWAREQRLHVVRYPANWREFGKRAESIRNEFMLADSRPDMILALPGGNDTRDLVSRALAARLYEAARTRVLAAVPAVDEIVIHPEPHGHADGFGAHRAALRPAVRETVAACLDGLMPREAIAALHLDYRNEGIRATVVLDRAVPDGAGEQAQARLAEMRAEGRTDLVALRLLGR